MLKCNTQTDWEVAKYFRQKYFFGPNNIEDPYLWTFSHPSHDHFFLKKEEQIIGYVHVQLWKDSRAAMRIIVVEDTQRNKSFGSKFLHLCENYLKNEGYQSIHVESNPAALNFYKKNGYIELPFNDPDGYESGPEDTALGKSL